MLFSRLSIFLVFSFAMLGCSKRSPNTSCSQSNLQAGPNGRFLNVLFTGVDATGGSDLNVLLTIDRSSKNSYLAALQRDTKLRCSEFAGYKIADTLRSRNDKRSIEKFVTCLSSEFYDRFRHFQGKPGIPPVSGKSDMTIHQFLFVDFTTLEGQLTDRLSFVSGVLKNPAAWVDAAKFLIGGKNSSLGKRLQSLVTYKEVQDRLVERSVERFNQGLVRSGYPKYKLDPASYNAAHCIVFKGRFRLRPYRNSHLRFIKNQNISDDPNDFVAEVKSTRYFLEDHCLGHVNEPAMAGIQRSYNAAQFVSEAFGWLANIRYHSKGLYDSLVSTVYNKIYSQIPANGFTRKFRDFEKIVWEDEDIFDWKGKPYPPQSIVQFDYERTFGGYKVFVDGSETVVGQPHHVVREILTPGAFEDLAGREQAKPLRTSIQCGENEQQFGRIPFLLPAPPAVKSEVNDRPQYNRTCSQSEYFAEIEELGLGRQTMSSLLAADPHQSRGKQTSLGRDIALQEQPSTFDQGNNEDSTPPVDADRLGSKNTRTSSREELQAQSKTNSYKFGAEEPILPCSK